ncbi:MBL fold metallo-hydrolase [Streptomyces sp. MI02-7b]|uniref:MBL fold metallo-hydrolase n=1 Tax=Streptomyces sp. MI02-7b TaxID=462941 RepID=UPI0029BD21CE|nr:MBL fold metallo-hydrolase [Streptomyces sp. MI02-7b]MDX3072569.1 MBL fold metallo-hydrolase [Streptomyces sp. MI02-7b]
MNTPKPLAYSTLVVDGAPRAGAQRLPDGGPIVSSPITTTLIHGETDAVLVDVPFTRDQIKETGDWIEASGRRLRHVYITHGHGDHWFGTAELLKRFPGVTVHATEGTIGLMRRQAGEGREQMWDVLWPGLIPESPVLAEPVPTGGLELEGRALCPVEVGHTDTDSTTVLHVPSIGLVVAGDVAYNGVHQYVVECGDGGLQAWLRALDQVEALNPTAVVAGHKNRDLPDSPAVIGRTRQYLHDVAELLGTASGAREFYDEMLRRHPDRINTGPVWYGAVALLGE